MATREELQTILSFCESQTDGMYQIIHQLAQREFDRLLRVGRKTEFPNDPKEQNRQRQKRFQEKKRQEQVRFLASRDLSMALASDRANGRYNVPKRGKKKK